MGYYAIIKVYFLPRILLRGDEKIYKLIIYGFSFFFFFLFADPTLAAKITPDYIEKSPAIEYNWGLGGPEGKTDNFVALFDQSQQLESGDYFIQTFADDGIKVYFNNMDKPVIEKWNYSWTTNISRSLLPNIKEGHYNIKTLFRDGTKNAAVYSHIIPFDSWLVYYYNNLTGTGAPAAAEVVKSVNGESFFYNKASMKELSYSSASLITAKRLDAGEYVFDINTDADIQLFIDGELVLDQFLSTDSQKQAIKVKINDKKNATNGEKNVHWIEVKYKHPTEQSKIQLSVLPYNDFMKINQKDGWIGEIFPNINFTGNSIILGKDPSTRLINDLDYNWYLNSPHPNIPRDYFSARFIRKYEIDETNVYSIKVSADDKVRVYVDGDKVIDSWKYIPGGNREVTLPLSKGIHDIMVEYQESTLNARIKLSITKNVDFTETKEALSYNWHRDGPVKNKTDNFTAKFDQSQYLDSGDYFIQTLADDGLIMEVNGETIINRWNYSSNIINRSLLTKVSEGQQNITTLYRDGILGASIFSHIVPFGDWLAYYYPNKEFSEEPTAAKIICAADKYGKLEEINWQESPVPGVIPKDNFSVRYVTAKRIPAGDYVLKTGADDGLQVYIDGKLVLDRFTPVGYREDSIKIPIKDHTSGNSDESDVHWIEVKYKEGILSSRVNVSLIPYADFMDFDPENGWVGEFYPNISHEGNPVVIGGLATTQQYQDLDFNWGLSSPTPLVPKDKFSSRFTKIINIDEPGYYVLSSWADDGIRVYVDEKLILDSWHYIRLQDEPRQVGINLSEGNHKIVIEHFDGKQGARLKFSLDKGKTTYSEKLESISYNWGKGSPNVEVQPDNFTATFDQSQYLKSGDYFFQTYADDGVTVDFNGKRIIDRIDYSFDSLIDRAILTNIKSGNQKVTTKYKEGDGNALLFSNVISFGDWLAYYYPNRTLTGTPTASKVVKANFHKYGALEENNGYGSPVPGIIPNDSFSAHYVTATRIKAGDYVLRTGADDGVQIFIDGELVLDRFTNGAFREDSKKVSIIDGENGDIHWIEVKYFEASQSSKLEVFLQPFDEAKNITSNDGWFGEFYDNKSFTGTPIIVGGKDAIKPIPTLNFNWDNNSPSPLLPKDNFSAIFTKKINIENPGNYAITVHADDGVKVYFNKKIVIDSLEYVPGNKRHAVLNNVEAGNHEIIVEYVEGILAAELKFEIDQVAATSFLEVDLRKPANITAKDIVNFFNKKKPDSILKNFAEDFIKVQNSSGINAQYLVAHAIWETGWGSSNLAIYKRNFFGYGAYDSCPFTCGYYFPTGLDSINYVAYKIKDNYLNPGGIYYNGPNLIGMNVKYATDQNWKNGIANLMESIKPFDAQYYDRVGVSTKQPPIPKQYDRDIPEGQPFPSSIFIDYPTDIIATTNTSVNFRTLPYVSSSTIQGLLTKDTEIIINGFNTDVKTLRIGGKDYKWYRVTVNGKNGWVNGAYFTIKNLLQVEASALNIRKDATTSSTILETVPDKTYLKIVLDSSGNPIKKNEWYQVYTSKNQKGYVSGEFVNIITH